MSSAPNPTSPTTPAPVVVATPGAEKPLVSSMKVYRRLLGYTRPYLGYFALSILGFAIAGGCKAALASVLKYFIDGLAAPDAPISTGPSGLRRIGMPTTAVTAMSRASSRNGCNTAASGAIVRSAARSGS